MLRHPWVVAVTLCLSPLVALRAEAQPDPRVKEVTRLMNEGEALKKAKRFEEALAKYRAAYDLLPSPALFFNFGTISRELGRLAEAANYLQRFLDEANLENPKLAQHARAARRQLPRIKKKLAYITVVSNVSGDATVFIDGKDYGTPPVRNVPVDPGEHEIVVEKPGFVRDVRLIETTYGERINIQATLLTKPSPPPPPPPPPIAGAPDRGKPTTSDVVKGEERPPPTVTSTPITSKWWFWTAVIGGVAVAAGATALALSSGDDFELGGTFQPQSTSTWDRP